MNLKIRKYHPAEDYDALIKVIESEGEDWENYFKITNRAKYQKALEGSITYVACVDDVVCGFCRSQTDFGFFIWVIDLLVLKDFRGNSIRKELLKRIALDFPNQDVFVMSDVDKYYEKLGYSKEGSIFKIM